MASESALDAKHSNAEKPAYYISYASASQHAFIIISKKIKLNGETRFFALASFGLYGESDCYCCDVSSSGLFGGENGRIRNDNFFLKRDVKIGVKSFEITAEKALKVMQDVIADSKIKQAIDTDKPERDHTSYSEQQQKEIFSQLEMQEKELHLYFQNDINKNSRGGPHFNGWDFNCKKYAIYTLRKAGIRDKEIEADRLPSKTAPGLRRAIFHRSLWVSALNIAPKIKQGIEYPKSYHKIFYEQENLVDATLALLKDYSSNSLYNKIFHCKRHHVATVKKVIADVQSKRAEFNTINKILAHLKIQLDPYRDMTGSIQRRIEFLEEQAENPNNHQLLHRQNVSTLEIEKAHLRFLT